MTINRILNRRDASCKVAQSRAISTVVQGLRRFSVTRVLQSRAVSCNVAQRRAINVNTVVRKTACTRQCHKPRDAQPHGVDRSMLVAAKQSLPRFANSAASSRTTDGSFFRTTEYSFFSKVRLFDFFIFTTRFIDYIIQIFDNRTDGGAHA